MNKKFLTKVLILAGLIAILSSSTVLSFLTIDIVITNTGNISASATTALSQTMKLHTDGYLLRFANGTKFYPRGIGHTGDVESLTGIWSGVGDTNFLYGYKWLWYGQISWQQLSNKIDETFEIMRTQWKANNIRMPVAVDWWWKDNVWANSSGYGGPALQISYRDYYELVVQRAALKGMQVNICPWCVYNYYDGQGKQGGFPGSWTTDDIAFLSTIDSNVTIAWRTWWLSVMNRLGKYGNVWFEMWNEPDGNSTQKIAFFNSVYDIYKTIRNAGYQNLILVQWYMGVMPTYNDFLWMREYYDGLKAYLGGENPVNIVYTWHAYRYWWNLKWATTYPDVLAQLNASTWVPATRTGGYNLTTLVNEAGFHEPYGEGDELNWWSALLNATRDLDIGFTAYYWLPPLGWLPDEALFENNSWNSTRLGWTPSLYGQAFIDAFAAPPL
jgi:hypothetical protein